MLAPDSVGLLVVLGLVGVGAMVLVLRHGHLLLRAGAGVLALVVVFAAGAASVNVYFGYFASWSDVTAGLGGGPAASTITAAPGSGSLTAAAVQKELASLPATVGGTLLSVDLPGPRSHLNRHGFVWLPPQYREAAYAHTRFPVLELIPGTPGQPADWITNLHVTTMLAAMTADRHIGPMVVVMAPSNPPLGTGNGEECTNKPIRGAQDATYMALDVPADVAAAFRVYRPGARWAVAGYSSGGYCATKLALQYPGRFGAVADLDGYLSPLEDGGLWHVIFYKNMTAVRANDVASILETQPQLKLPSFYLMAGSANSEDMNDLVTLQTLLRGRASVTAVVNRGGNHTFRVWRDVLPGTLVWVWRHIDHAPPKAPATKPPRAPLIKAYVGRKGLPAVVRPAR